jgi:glucose-6-phosphate 1-dehydrogenase
VAESKGIGGRAGYFDSAGTLRDMLQNHMMQLLSVVAMEPPSMLDAIALRDEMVMVLRAVRPLLPETVDQCVLRAQYRAGNGSASYLDEPGVVADSMTETFVAAKFHIDNWRWSGVPFYLRTGKRMRQDLTLVSLCLKQPPLQLFGNTNMQGVETNWIVLSIQPQESMHIEMQAKEPGLDMHTRTLQLQAFFRPEDERPLGAYETLLLDIIEGDRSLFIRFDEVEWSWKVVDPILRQFDLERGGIAGYPAGSWGPEQATALFGSADQRWRNHI